MLGAGFSTTQKSQEVVHSGVQQASSSLALTGDVFAEGGTDGNGNSVANQITFYVTNTAGGTPVDLDKTIITYTDNNNFKTFPYDATIGAWTYTPVIKNGNANNLVENGDAYKIELALNNGNTTNGATYSYMNININGVAQNDYQINFDIPWESGMNADFSNIRFYANNNSWNNGTSLNYWIEGQTISSAASVWVPLPANCNKVVCEWGLPGQTTSQSNGNLVFPDFFDNFDSTTTLNPTNWQVSWFNGVAGSVSVANGILTGTETGNNNILCIRAISGPQSGNYAFRIRHSETINGNGQADVCVKESASGANTYYGGYLGSGLLSWGYFGNSWGSTISSGNAGGLWHTDEIMHDGTYAKYRQDDGAWNSWQISGSTGYFGVMCGDDPSQSTMNIDWALIRKYDATPPIVTVDPTIHHSTSNVTSGFAPPLNSLPGVNEKVKIEVKPPEGAVLGITRTMPPAIANGNYYPVY
jgi:archaellin